MSKESNEINEIVVNGVVYVPKGKEAPKMGTTVLGQPAVILRCMASGVFAGVLKSQSPDGKLVTLTNCRRIWHWEGAATCSQLALEGVKSPLNCKFPQAVPELTVTDVLEIIPMTSEAWDNVMAVPEWKN